MENSYTDIVRHNYEELYRPFMNLLRSKYTYLDADTIDDFYQEAWMDVRSYILEGKVDNKAKLKALILKMGLFKAYNYTTRGPEVISIDSYVSDDGEDKFNPILMKADLKRIKEEAPGVYDDPDLKGVLARELSYIPEPCNKVLKFYYYEGLSMKMIAEAMNYSSQATAKVTKKRCFDKLKERVMNSVRRLGIIG